MRVASYSLATSFWCSPFEQEGFTRYSYIRYSFTWFPLTEQFISSASSSEVQTKTTADRTKFLWNASTGWYPKASLWTDKFFFIAPFLFTNYSSSIQFLFKIQTNTQAQCKHAVPVSLIQVTHHLKSSFSKMQKCCSELESLRPRLFFFTTDTCKEHVLQKCKSKLRSDSKFKTEFWAVFKT